MDQYQRHRWRLIRRLLPGTVFRWAARRKLLWAGSIAALAFLTIVICGYLLGWKWTGLPKKTFWDWLQLLIIPAVLAGGGLWFNRQQREQELQTANSRAQDEALQAYLDQMSAMLIPPNKDLPSLYKARPSDSLSSVARARTLTVLPRLDGDRKAQVAQFLYESGLISLERPVLDLFKANLREAKLFRAYLSGALLDGADLSEAYLSGAFLSEANLSEANLSEAFLSKADLYSCEGVTNDQLRAAWALDDATMPNGQKYEDWLKSKGHGEDG